MINLLLKERSKSIFFPSNIGLILLRITLLICSVLYGVGGCFILKYWPNSSTVSAENIKIGFNGILGALIILRNILPIYKTKTRLIPRYVPVTDSKIILIEYIESIYNPFSIYILIFISILTFSIDYNFIDFSLTAAFLLNSFSIEIILKKFIENSYPKRLILTLIFTFIVSLFAYFTLHFSSIYSILGYCLFYLLIFFLINLGLNKIEIVYRYRFTNNNTIREKNFYINLLFARKSLRISLLLAFLFKCLILVGAIRSFLYKGHYLFDLEFIQYLFLYPVVYFTYIFNNFFGYVSEIWLISRFSGNRREVYSSFLKSLLIIIVVDLPISTVASYLLAINPVTFVYKYLLLLIMMAINGFVGSLLLPNRVDSNLSFTTLKSNTSLPLSILSMALISFTFIESNQLCVLVGIAIISIQITTTYLWIYKKNIIFNQSFYEKVIR
jgi:hypothetical protein